MEVVEISSDSSHSIILPNVDFKDKKACNKSTEIATFENCFTNSAENVSLPSEPQINENNVNSANSDGDLLKKLYAKYSTSSLNSIKEIKKYTQQEVDDNSCALKRKSCENENSDKRMTKKKHLELERNKRKLDQQNKKELAEKEKALKKAAKAMQKNNNPDECLKNIIVKIDDSLLAEFGEALVEKLNNNDIQHKTVKQTCENIISWMWKVQTMERLIEQIPASDEKQYLLVLSSTKFKSLVINKTLIAHIQSISFQLGFKHLTIAVFGLDKMTEEQEYAVMEVEMFFKCYWQFMKKLEDLSSLIFVITKAVAQIPYKLEKQEKYRLQNEYLAEVNKDTVRVDKNGNGLNRLWKQMLTMLPLVRLETAEAICSAYPTPTSLLKGYGQISDKEILLQDLLIKRTNGASATNRRIGPELSKKCANFFCSTENIYI